MYQRKTMLIIVLFINITFFIGFRKVYIIHNTLSFVKRHAPDYDYRILSLELEKVINSSTTSKNPAFIILNKHALPLTLNWLCGLKKFPSASRRIVAITLDATSRRALREHFPQMPVLQLPSSALADRFKFGNGPYQLFQLVRARMASSLCKMGISFWMLQPDTLWNKNLFDEFEPSPIADVTFDQEGSTGLLSKMIAGGNFYVKASERSMAYFDELAIRLTNNFATDNNIMGALCSEHFANVQCEFIPFRIVANWRWFSSAYNFIPHLLQLDNSDGGSKLARTISVGFIFYNSTSQQCIDNSEVRLKTSHIKTLRSSSKSSVVADILQHILEITLERFPTSERLIRQTILPKFAYIIML